MNPLVYEFSIFVLLCAVWLQGHKMVLSVNSSDVFHVALSKRDVRKARFYFWSVWIGIAAIFMSARLMEASTAFSFDSLGQKVAFTGTLRGVELWGILVVGAVWSRVGKYASHANSDGKSLTEVRDDSPNRNQK